MWQHYYRRQLRRARHQAKAQQRALLKLEIEGFVAVTLRTATSSLTMTVERATGAQLAGTLAEALRARRRTLQTELDRLAAALTPPSAPSAPLAEPPLPPGES